jgi:predicted transcriptional regulator
MEKRLNIEDYAWVLRGKQKRKIISTLDEEPKMPSEVKEETNLSLNNVSDILRLFAEKKLAKCLNPEAKTGRLYVLTEKGKIIRDKINKKKISKDYY